MKPEKGSNPRIFKLSNKLLGMLTLLPKSGDRIFGRCDYKDFYGGLILQRKRVANKLSNPRTRHLTPLSIRHWKGTIEYHRTRDILHVKEVLGHKDIRKTLIYIQMDQAIFKDENQYICKAATTVKQAEELIEAGFEFICDVECTKLFRKLK